MHKRTDKKNIAARAATEVIIMDEQELRKLLNTADKLEENDDFYREQFIEEQLDDDCIDEEEGAFMMGYLAA